MIRKKKSKVRVHFFTKIILFLNIVAAMILLLSYSASAINPRYFWPTSFLGLAYPILLLVNLFFIVYWLFKRPKFALISSMVVLIGWKFLASHFGFRESTAIGVPKSSQKFIRIMSYNVHEFKQFGDKNTLLSKELFLNIIRDEQPDIICFQEFFTRQKNAYDFIKAVSNILQTSYYYYNPTKGNNYETVGLAIFSKYPILKTGVIKFEKGNNNESIFIDLKTKHSAFRVYNVHLQSVRFKPEDYKYLGEMKKQMVGDVESSRRIGGRLKRAFIKRSGQVALLKQHTLKCKIPYVLAGDFNDTPISYAVNQMLSGGLINAFREKGSGLGITYNGDFPNFQIDYILASPHFSVKNYRIIEKKISDHYAIRSDLELK